MPCQTRQQTGKSELDQPNGSIVNPGITDKLRNMVKTPIVNIRNRLLKPTTEINKVSPVNKTTKLRTSLSLDSIPPFRQSNVPRFSMSPIIPISNSRSSSPAALMKDGSPKSHTDKIVPDDLEFLSDSLHCIRRKHKNAKIVLTGDFNVPEIDWYEYTYKNGTARAKKLLDMVSDFFLTQHVMDITRYISNWSDPYHVRDLQMKPGISDHERVVFTLSTSMKIANQSKHRIYDY